MSNTIIIKNREPQAISIRGGGEVLGITTVYVNGIDVTEGSVAYVIVPTKTSELTNDSGFINHEVDPTVPYYVKQITQADINAWNDKQEQLVSGTNIKTVNSQSLLGSGNIDISTSYSAGTGINISDENVISNTITSYNDLTDLPTIPTATSELLNDSGYLVADDLANVAFSGSYADLSDVPDLSEYATLDTEDLENYYTKRFMWNILPRATGSGVSVSLSDTLNEAPIELSLAPSELSQEATPTPSSPQTVHTISGDNTIKVNNIQEADIELGDIEYCKIGNYKDEFIRTSGKNLFDKDNANVLNLYINTSGEILTASNGKSIYIECEPSTTYTISRTAGARFRITDTSVIPANGITGSQFIGQDAASKLVITTNANAKYLVVNYYTGNSDTLSEQVIRDSIMIQKGNIENPQYEPYGSNEWYIKKNIGKVVLDGTESGWQKVTQSSGAKFTSNQIINNCVENNAQICSHFGNNKITVYTTGWVDIYTTDMSLEDWKSWLASNLPIVYYACIPTYTPITGTLETQLENAYYNLTAYDNQTNISQTNNDLPFVISASTPKTLVNM